MNEKEIPFGKLQVDKIVLKAWGGHPDREVGEVRNNDIETSVQYFLNKFEELSQKIKELEEEIKTSGNKGSFLMKLIHLKEQLPTHDGLGDYQKLYDQLVKNEEFLKDIVQKNRERNTEVKKTLLEEVKVAAEKINWREATEDIHEIKARWIKTGNAKENEQEPLDAEFWGVLEKFFEKKRKFYEDKKRLGEKRKKEYEAVIEKAAQVAKLFGKERFDLIKSLKQEWQNIGNIPREEYTELLKTFHWKLKAGKPQPTPDLKSLSAELDAFISGGKLFHFKIIDNYKQSLKAFRPQSAEDKKLRHQIFQKIQMLLERDFIDKIAAKRFSNFRELEKGKKKTIRIGILEELLGRDKADLTKYLENSANFSSGSSRTIDLIEKKLMRQKDKIETKEELLKLLKDGK